MLPNQFATFNFTCLNFADYVIQLWLKVIDGDNDVGENDNTLHQYRCDDIGWYEPVEQVIQIACFQVPDFPKSTKIDHEVWLHNHKF